MSDIGVNLPDMPKPRYGSAPRRVRPIRALKFVFGGLWGLICRILGIGLIDQRVDGRPLRASTFWPMSLAAITGVGLLISALAANGARSGATWGPLVLFLAVTLFFFPAAMRIALRNVARSERLIILIIVTMGLYALRIIRAPQFFLGFDEYLHWTTAQNMIDKQQLFTTNVLFPVGPAFPGLEIVVTSISEMTGLSVFWSATICLAVARVLFVSALFFIYEAVTKSPRVAALACVFYMGCSTFVFFDTNFSYESLALPLLAFALLLEVNLMSPVRGSEKPLLLAILLTLGAVAATHHVTSYGIAAIFFAFVILEFLRGGPRAVGWPLVIAAIAAVVIPILWSRALGNPTRAYLGPVFEGALRSIGQLLQFGSSDRKMFTSDSGVVAPLWERVTAIGSVLFVCAGLAFGFFRSLSWAGLSFTRQAKPGGSSWILARLNSRLAFLTLLTFAYPISIVFRLTRSGWEIGNRMGPFAFLGVGVVLAIVVTTFPRAGRDSLLRALIIAAGATAMVVGGVISSEGPRLLVPKSYQVSADAASIEPMGIDAAIWTKDWLGKGNHFAADRTNRLLLSTFGRQLVSTTLQHHYDAGEVLVADKVGPYERSLMNKLQIDYLFADLRLTTGLPVVGAYFDGGEADLMLSGPPRVQSFLKFDHTPGASRIFDNGYTIIYDVRDIDGRR